MANEIWQQIVRLYKEGLSVRQIKGRLIIPQSHRTISRWLKKAGISRSPGGSRCKYPTLMPIAKKLYLQGLNTREIAELYKIEKGTVESWIQKWGIGRKGGFQRGKNHSGWKNNATEKRYGLRPTARYQRWRLAVLKRDSFTCCGCGKAGGELHVHHILSFGDYPALRTKIENGVTLCRSCHNSLHHRNRHKQEIA